MNEETMRILCTPARARAIVDAIAHLPSLSTDVYEKLWMEQRSGMAPPAIPEKPGATDAERWDCRLARIRAEYALSWSKKGEIYCIDNISTNVVKCGDCRDKYADGFRTIVFPYKGDPHASVPGFHSQEDSFHLSEYTFRALQSRAPQRHASVPENLGRLERALKNGYLD